MGSTPVSNVPGSGGAQPAPASPLDNVINTAANLIGVAGQPSDTYFDLSRLEGLTRLIANSGLSPTDMQQAMQQIGKDIAMAFHKYPMDFSKADAVAFFGSAIAGMQTGGMSGTNLNQAIAMLASGVKDMAQQLGDTTLPMSLAQGVAIGVSQGGINLDAATWDDLSGSLSQLTQLETNLRT